jgi:uncharacterized protein YaiI (UPF0178 family)
VKIWVDADACPNVIKDILYRAANRTKVNIVFVANQLVQTPTSPFLSSVRVDGGFDVADNYIVKHMNAGDLVITADIPLAFEVVEKKGYGLNPRGELYTTENIRQRLQIRDVMEQVRSSGERVGGPSPLNQRERQTFANALDSFLAKHP